ETAKWAGKKIRELADRKKELDELGEDVKDTLDDANAFWQSHTVGPHLERTEPTISVARTDETIEDAKAEEKRPEFLIRFGAGKRFFLAGGIAASSANLRRFKVVDGFVLDRAGKAVNDDDGNPKFGKVVGLEEDSVGRVAPAVLLHGILWRPSKAVGGVGFSLGIGAAGSDDTVIEWFAGPTLSFADDHLFITLGAFRGQETELAGDFYLGAEVPDDATLSTVERKSWTFGLGLTFRIP
ncbi:MAG TPA: hypothetical protein VF111_15160, partial [Thermoanaerobaculia bacterium]